MKSKQHNNRIEELKMGIKICFTRSKILQYCSLLFLLKVLTLVGTMMSESVRSLVYW
jgi:hypothetical protein